MMKAGEESSRKTGNGRYVLVFIVSVVTILSLVARASGWGFTSDDFLNYLSPWFNEIDELGKASLAQQVGNYGIPYQIIILVLTYLPIPSIAGYKLVSVAFDYLLACEAWRLTRRMTGSDMLGLACYSLIVFLPPVVLNSSTWAQCDSIYAFFCLLSLRLLLFGSSRLSYACLGVALAFKLQAIFIFPFFVLHFLVSRDYPSSRFGWTALSFYGMSLPGIIARGDILAPFVIYFNQTTIDPSVAIDFPGFWAMFFNIDSGSTFLFSLAVTAVVLFLIGALVALSKASAEGYSPKGYLMLATLIVWTCVEFLPSMHQRYGYLCLVLLTIALVVTREKLVASVWLASLIATIVSYSAYLYRMPELTMWFQTVLFVVAVLMFVAWVRFACQVLGEYAGHLMASADRGCQGKGELQ
ncbi:MAG: hypothetical protein UCH28_09765 [Adlercreutzia sp.]|nr:hypothetical protein [Adlercreutzia sp.]